MTWFAFPQGTNTLQLFNLNGVAEKAMVATMAHGYATQAEAIANPNANPDSAQDIQIAADQQAAGAVAGGGATGVLEAGTYDTSTKKYTKQGTTAKSVADKAASAASGLLKDTIGISGISGTNLAIRVAKVAIGGILVIVGLVSFTGIVSKAPAIVKTAVKAAPLL